MNSLKNMFTVKKKDPVPEEKPAQEDVKQTKLTFFESGYGSSTQAEGNERVFRTCLEEVFMDYKGKCRENERLQDELKKPYFDEKGRQETELKKRRTALGLLEEAIAALGQKIKGFKQDMIEVKRNPKDYDLFIDKRPKAQFYIGLFVLLPITLYLLVFYISASYSAFFKNFDSDRLGEAIFDAEAFSKAIAAGWLQAIFVATIPFAFMGLGYLIHMFQKKKGFVSYLKIFLLFAITFIFDAILAYLIEQKLYDFYKTPSSPPFNLSIAFSSVKFWGIIFAGFIVYIIWGLVFDFIMKEYENFDRIQSFIRSKREEIANNEAEITKIKEETLPIKEEISGLEGKIADLQRTIDGFVFSNKHYLTYHSEYVKGWFLAIADNFDGKKRKEELYRNCEEQEQLHLNKHNITNEDYEGRLYKLVN